MTVGVIPPALDQVLIGAVDRSRNPDLQLALVLGLNESVFPAPPPPRNLLTESDCAELDGRGLRLGPGLRQFLGRERFLGYIACTRARRRLVVSCSQRGADDQPLNPSPFFSHLKSFFPGSKPNFSPAPTTPRPSIPRELIPRLLRLQNSGGPVDEFLALAGLRRLASTNKILRPRVPAGAPFPRAGRAALRPGPAHLRQPPRAIRRLRLPLLRQFRFAGGGARSCLNWTPGKKAPSSTWRWPDFHQQLQDENKTWRELTPPEARRRMAAICAALIPQFEEGLLAADAPSRFAARGMARALEDFVAAMVEWMRQYDFEPRAAEVEFGGPPEGGGLPAWELDLGGGRRLVFRGRIDRD